MSRVPFKRMLPMAMTVIELGSGASARAAELVAANGITGAGTRSDGNGRAWAELGFSGWDEQAVVWTELGLGLKLGPSLEVEAQLPIAFGMVDHQDDVVDSAYGSDAGGFPAWVGNPYFGANLLSLGDPCVRWRVGAGFTLPVTGADDFPSDVQLLPLWAAGNQDPHLWYPGGASFIGRARFELDAGQLTFSFDLASIVTLRVWDYDAFPLERTTVVFLQPAFEIASYVSPDTLIGARLPMVWGTLEEDFTLSVVPFLRQALGQFFAEAQLTLGVYGVRALFPIGNELMLGAQLGVGAHF